MLCCRAFPASPLTPLSIILLPPSIKTFLFGQVSGLMLKGLAMLAGFGASMYLAQHLELVEYGSLALALTIAGFGTTLGAWGTGPWLVRAIARIPARDSGDRERSATLLDAMLLALLTSAAVAIALFLGRDLLASSFESPLLAHILPWFCLTIPPAVLLLLASQTIRALNRPLLANALAETSPSILKLAAVLVLAVVAPASMLEQYPMAIFLLAFVDAGLACVVLGTLAGWRWVRVSLSWPRMRKTMAEATVFMTISLSYLTTNLADIFMVGWLIGPEEVGLYTVAAAISGLFTVLLMVSNSIASPQVSRAFSEADESKLRVIFYRDRTFMLAAGALPIGALILAAEPLLQLWGPAFVSAYAALLILSTGRYLQLITGSAGLFLTMAGEERTTRAILFGSGILNIALNFLLIPSFGINGAAIATVIALLLSRTWMYLKMKRILQRMRMRGDSGEQRARPSR